MVFPVVVYGCESCSIQKTEHQRTDAFELWCWRRLLRVPWTARRSNPSIRKEISPEYSLGGLMLKLKLQYFGHLMWRTDSLEKILILGKIEGGKRGDDGEWDGWMASPSQWTWVWVSSRSWWWQGGLAGCSPWGHRELDTAGWLDWTAQLFGSLFPKQGSNLGPWQWNCRLLSTRLPIKSLDSEPGTHSSEPLLCSQAWASELHVEGKPPSRLFHRCVSQTGGCGWLQVPRPRSWKHS